MVHYLFNLLSRVGPASLIMNVDWNGDIANSTKLIVLVLIVLVLLVLSLLVLLLIVLVLDIVVLLKKLATKSDFRFLIRPTFYIGQGGFAFATRGGVCVAYLAIVITNFQSLSLFLLAQAALSAPPKVAFAMRSWPLLLPTFSLSLFLSFSFFSVFCFWATWGNSRFWKFVSPNILA